MCSWMVRCSIPLIDYLVAFDVLLFSSLSYEKSQTLFRVGQPPFSPIMREVPLTNQFDIPVVLYDVKLPFKAQEYFTVSLDCTCISIFGTEDEIGKQAPMRVL